MEESPSKRRKTSPTTAVAINAPATPSRIPVPRQDGTKITPRRPSFASPTKASLSRHNPQLLKRQSTPGNEAPIPGSAAKLQNLFAKALGETQAPSSLRSTTDGQESRGDLPEPTARENEPRNVASNIFSQRPTTPRSRGVGAIKGGLSAKPRRVSRSPSKQPRERPAAVVDERFVKDLPDDVNPFQKKGLRRSPVPGQVENQTPSEEHHDPFRRTGLRRSPLTSQFDAQPEGQPQREELHSIFPQPSRRILPVASSAPVQPLVEVGDMRASQPRRRSPRIAQVEAEVSGKDIDPFRSKTLRRSPIPALQKSSPSQITKSVAVVSTTPTGPLPSHHVLTDVLSRPQQEASRGEPPAQELRFPNVIEIPKPTVHEEPELPPTPVQRGIPDPVVTTPPIGIHDTPSKRARRHREMMEKKKSSPLKPRDPRPVEPKETILPKKGQTPQVEKPVKRRKSARFFIPEDPYASKKKERDDLLRELQQLRADVALANQENERLRLGLESKDHHKTSPNVEAVVAMLHRSTAPELPTIPKPKPTSIFKSIGSFLPFRPRKNPTAGSVSKKPIPSYLPLHLEDPLPYLQAFSPLAYTSTITAVPLAPSVSNDSDMSYEEIEKPILHRHVVSASHHSGLFASRFAMTVDSSSLSIATIEILRLDMPAERELGTFIRTIARAEGPLAKDVSAICWAMGRWTEVSIERARFWCNVEHEFGTPESRHKSLQRRRKRKRLETAIEAEEGITSKGEMSKENQDGEKSKWTRRQLLSNMGRTAFELSSDEVELRFEWKVSFDWTGEVESSISANARLPRNWQEKDDRQSLGKVSETFRRLVKERGPLAAVRATVGLFMPV